MYITKFHDKFIKGVFISYAQKYLHNLLMGFLFLLFLAHTFNIRLVTYLLNCVDLNRKYNAFATSLPSPKAGCFLKIV